jgi:hypothetical protein
MRGVSKCKWLVIAIAVCGLAAPARAAEVDWRAPDPCPDAAELRFSIERTIGMPLSHALPLHFEVHAERSAEGYVARMDVAGTPPEAPRRRVLVASDCSRLADLVAVTAAIALGEDAATSDAETSPGFTPTERARSEATSPPLLTEAAPRGVADRPEVDELASSSEPAPAWSPAFSLWFLADAGSLERPGAGVALGAGLGRETLQLRALATLLLEQRATLDAGRAPGAGADLALAAAALSLCAAPFATGSRWSVAGCAGWELGRLSGEGTGVLRPVAGAALWSAPRADATLAWALGSTGLELGAMFTLAVPLVRDDFVLAGLGSVHRPAPVVGRAALGINWMLE